MRVAVQEIPPKSITKSSLDFGTKNAWAQYVRRRFQGQNLVKRCMQAFRITEGQAKGLVYAQATVSTIDAVLDNAGPLGGFALSLEIAAIRHGVKLEEYIEHQAQEAAHARIKHEERERHLAALSARLSEPRFVDRRDG